MDHLVVWGTSTFIAPPNPPDGGASLRPIKVEVARGSGARELVGNLR